ncbi:MAG: glycoside hydrolase family 3 N-terminal domain-containing protein [Candidatus Dojkabacteria bacterium]
MKPKVIFITLLILFFLSLLSLIVSIQYQKRNIQKEETTIEEIIVEESEPPEPQKPYEEILLSQMTPEEKVGQIFMFGVEGNTTLTPQNKQFLIDSKVGGVLLMSRNITNEIQLKTLIEEIQTTNTIPLFISIDQEGGVVSRIKWNPTLMISQASIKSPEQAYTVAKNKAEILKSIGINMNLAPVVENSSNANSFIYQRTFRGSIDDIVNKSIATVDGYEEVGVISVLKHYPGHGTTLTDPHYKLPRVNITNEQWEQYTETFRRVIAEGKTDAVMIGHILFPNIDAKPTTISSEIISNRLIKGLNYQGLIISDDMEMDALVLSGSPTEVAKEALLAGIDILIYSKYTPDNRYSQNIVYNYILSEVKNGNIDIDQKVLKILKVKIKYEILPIK